MFAVNQTVQNGNSQTNTYKLLKQKLICSWKCLVGCFRNTLKKFYFYALHTQSVEYFSNGYPQLVMIYMYKISKQMAFQDAIKFAKCSVNMPIVEVQTALLRDEY